MLDSTWQAFIFTNPPKKPNVLSKQGLTGAGFAEKALCFSTQHHFSAQNSFSAII